MFTLNKHCKIKVLKYRFQWVCASKLYMLRELRLRKSFVWACVYVYMDPAYFLASAAFFPSLHSCVHPGLIIRLVGRIPDIAQTCQPVN